MSRLRIVTTCMISLLTLIVMLQNTQAVKTNLLFFTVTMPNAVLLFGTLILGFTAGMLAAWHMLAKRPTDTASETPSTVAV